jgi:RNA polymerase sigma-70 factor, ECF subfamily
MAIRQTETQLIQQAIAGDTTAVGQLLCLYRPKLSAYLERHFPEDLRGDLEPQDILQDVHFQVFRSIGRFQPQGDEALYRWLIAIARNLLTDALRKQHALKRGWGRRADLDRGGDQHIARMLQQLVVYRRTPSRSAMSHEMVATLERAMQNLPDDYRQALQLRYLEELDVNQSAARMGRSPGSIQMLCCRALKSLREQLLAESSCV